MQKPIGRTLEQTCQLVLRTGRFSILPQFKGLTTDRLEMGSQVCAPALAYLVAASRQLRFPAALMAMVNFAACPFSVAASGMSDARAV